MPFVFMPFVESKKPNSLKSFSLSSYFIPIPLSITCISIIPTFSSFMASKNNFEDRLGIDKSSTQLIFLQIIVTLPPVVLNLIAFYMRFKKTYYNL